MTNDFPPKPTCLPEIERMLAVLASVMPDRTATYLSAPITTGPRFAAWRRASCPEPVAASSQEQAAYLREVVTPNLAHAGAVIRQLRRNYAGILIDPTVLKDLPGWTQCDYRHFWACVIERFAREVVFLDGWAYSSGCAYEFLVAHRSGAETLDEMLRPLPRGEGMRMLCAALEEMQSDRLPTAFLEGVTEELARLADTGTAEPPESLP